MINTETISNAYAKGTGTGFAHNAKADAGASALLDYAVHEDVYAAYGQYQFGFGKLRIFTGLRIETTKESFDAFAVNENFDTQPISSDHRYTDFLPSLQTRYQFTHTLIGRAVYSSTIGRPGYNQLNPGLSINLGQNTASQGNPDIKPTHSHNVDLSIEEYLPHAGIVAFGLFYKDLKNYIVTTTTKSFPNNGIFAAQNGMPVMVQTFKNGSPANAVGYEINYEQRFTDILPGLWSGFGVAFNWTGVSSRIEIRPGDYTTLPSTAKNSGNATIFYERPHVFDVRIGANYISRSLFTASPSAAALDIYSEKRTSLDFGSRYFVTDAIRIYLDAKNLTNTPLTYTEGTSGRPVQRETYRSTVLFGFEASF